MRRLAKILCILSAFSALPSLSIAGTESSGGGAGIFCPASVPNQPAVQLLDLYEGKVLEGYNIPETDEPHAEQLAKIANLFAFDFSLHQDFRFFLADIISRTRFLPPGVSIHVPSDLGNDAVPLPTGCTLGAIGFYRKDGTLLISSDAFQSLSETQKAAFFAHEALYKMYRRPAYYYPSSAIVRRLVANLFSDLKTEESVRSLSRYVHVTVEAVDPFANPTPRPGPFWHPSPGKEERFVIPEEAAAVLLDRVPEKAKIRLINDLVYDEDINVRHLGCTAPGQWRRIKLPKDASPEERFLEISLPADCKGLAVSVLSSSTMEQPDHSPTRVELEIDGEKWLEGTLRTSGSPNAYGGQPITLHFYFKE